MYKQGGKGGLEIRRVDEQHFLSQERDILYWFLYACKASLASTEDMIGDLKDEEIISELRYILDSIRAYRDSIYTEDAPSDRIAGGLWDKLSERRSGRLFLGNLAFCLIDMFVDSSRRSVEKPVLRMESIPNAISRDRILSLLPDDLAAKASKAVRGVEGFGEFVPGMFSVEGNKDEREEGKEGKEAVEVPVVREDVQDPPAGDRP